MNGYLRTGIATVVILSAALLLPRIAATRDGSPSSRELLIVARNMTYYVGGGEDANPTLRFKAGERIRLIFRSEDAGMQHDFRIPDWQVATDTLNGKGEDIVEFRVPARTAAESSTYSCTPHAALMNGRVVVE